MTPSSPLPGAQLEADPELVQLRVGRGEVEAGVRGAGHAEAEALSGERLGLGLRRLLGQAVAGGRIVSG